MDILELAVEENLLDVIEKLCLKGINIDVVDDSNDSLLWKALDTQKFEVAKILVNQFIYVFISFISSCKCHSNK